jgi:hypothetical protein
MARHKHIHEFGEKTSCKAATWKTKKKMENNLKWILWENVYIWRRLELAVDGVQALTVAALDFQAQV